MTGRPGSFQRWAATRPAAPSRGSKPGAWAPDGNGRLELTRFHSPPTQDADRPAAANTPGIRHLAFAVEDIDAVVAGLRARGPEGIFIELAEQIG